VTTSASHLAPGDRPRRSWLDAIVVVAAAAAILASFGAPRLIHWIAKPLATIACLAIAADGGVAVSKRYRLAVIAGLAWSTAGDIMLMLPGDHFIAGLASFLVAHLCYIVAFVGDGGFQVRAGVRPLAVVALFGWLFVSVGAKLGPLFIPVLVYALVIGTMAWQASARRLRRNTIGAAMASWGALSFVVSDFSLAMNRFGTPFPASEIVILGTYWLAQYLIARSVGDPA
jgi:uncharacterized membrane protein YhhN